MYGEAFNIAHIEPCSHIYGPGLRFVIWVQGCSLGCPGCWNQNMWSSAPNRLIPRYDLLEWIIGQRGIKGVTLLGGEPLQQLEDTLWLLKEVKKTDLDTMVYTGYEMDEIKACPQKSSVLEHTDILVAGRYEENCRNIGLKWRGSENQKIRCLSTRYESHLFDDQNEVEIYIESDGSMAVTGYPDENLLKSLHM